MPLLDHLIVEMQERFGQQQILASKLSYVPYFLCKDSALNLNEVINFYHDDLPNPSVVDTELSRWKIKWLHQTCLPYSLRETIQQCGDAEFFPNIFTLLRIACTLPVTCENERANSTLERVKA